jgi:TetR/AcrR family transcriptional repressor of bet genes
MPGKKVSEETRREDIVRAAYDVAARQGLEALTLRAVAARADVSHGTVVFHFKRKRELVAGLLDRVLYATAVLRVPDAVAQITRPSERMHALLRAEMDRLSTDPRHFRLLLDYWTIGVRHAAIRQKLRVALEQYRAGFTDLAEAIVNGEFRSATALAPQSAAAQKVTPAGIAAVAVSLIHGCALQSVIDPKGFDVQQHFDAAAHMLGRIGNDRQVGRPAERVTA